MKVNRNFIKLLLFIIIPFRVFGAVGCDLNDPDRDIKRFFPLSTGYKTEYFTIKKEGGEELLNRVESELGDNFSGLYETIDVPYSVYTVYKDNEIIGYMHGINQRGKYGGLQVFLAYNPNGSVKNFYYQKLTSKKAKILRSPEFAKQFEGLSYEDFKNYNPKTQHGFNRTENFVLDEGIVIDYYYTLRAIKKNMLLMNIFVFDKK
ncbi:MAG: hypothetical protein LBC92_03090 [Rickettsiales bacterium]|jgi:hypothetical protein|nr:hypothetical protein [Rickettsiales bacterium]